MITYIPSAQFDGKFREDRILRAIDTSKYQSLLYVGARPQRMDHIKVFDNYDITILEIWKKNVDKIHELVASQKWNVGAVGNLKKAKSVELLHGDVINYEFYRKYDVSMWWHGPEHVDESQLEKAIRNLESCTQNVVILGCPWGEYEQKMDNNPYEEHLSSLQPEFFEKLGYKVEVHGQEGAGSNIMSIKYMSDNG